MPRGNRHFLPGQVWHITHRCHQQAFLLKFSQDRQHYLRWLFEARKRFGLCVLNYMATSNHIHLLVRDAAPNVISQSIQLIAGPHPPRKPEVLQTVSFRHRLVCVHLGNSDDIYARWQPNHVFNRTVQRRCRWISSALSRCGGRLTPRWASEA